MAEQRTPTWTLADRLRKSREDADLTLKEMAQLLGVHRNTPGAWEADLRTPNKGMVRLWAEHTDVTFEWLEEGTITLSEPAKRLSTWDDPYGYFAPRLFDPDELPLVIDLRDHVLAQMNENDSFIPYANAS